MAAKKRIKKQSLAEFHAWLEGVEELQPEGWAPNAVQWKLIRNKIDGIKETIVEKVVEQQAQAETNITRNPANPYPGAQARLMPSQLIQAPPVEGGVPTGQVTMSSEAKQMFNANGGKTKTPDTDASDGNVVSGFA